MRADKGATASFLKAVAHLMIYIETDSPQFRKCLRVIVAQWALESNLAIPSSPKVSATFPA